MEKQTCYICNEQVTVKDIWLCKEHAFNLNRHFESGFCLIKKPEFANHCMICGEWENRIILQIPDNAPYCNVCIDNAINAYYSENKLKTNTELRVVTNILSWLEKWYALNCNGDWEHGYGVHITTLDNPGWHVEMDLKDTYLSDIKPQEMISIDNGENDWRSYKIEEYKYTAFGDPAKLELLLNKFREIVEENSK